MPVVVEGSTQDFIWSATDEPHASRRKAILEKYPQVKELYGTDWRTFPAVLLLAFCQVSLTLLLSDASWFLILPLAYILGGTFTHSLSLGAHELSHNLCFKTARYNQYLAIFSSIPSGIPSAVTFKKYHLDHHTFLGVEGVDMDVPTHLEGRLFRSTLGKLLWVFCMPLSYAIRPVIVKPKPKGKMELLNGVVCLLYVYFVYSFYGYKSLSYMLLSLWLGMGLHPCAGHFIAEHFVFKGEYETHSYYGPLNYITFFVGYHNEHHDFPHIPCTRLPLLRKIAPEFYNHLPSYQSWTRVLYDFITSDSINCFSRVVRKRRPHTYKSKNL
eukprot:Sdes_comp17589_c0_seq1m6834